MTDVQLDEALKSMGKTCFVRYFRALSDESLSDEDVKELMLRNEGYTTVRNRVSNGRRIIRAGRAREALNMVVTSRVDSHVRDEARKLRDGLS